MSLKICVEKLEHLSIVRLREASCLALVLLSCCLFLVAQLLTSSVLLCVATFQMSEGGTQASFPVCPQVNLHGLKALPWLAQVRGCLECRAGGCWMALSPLRKRVTSHLAVDTARKIFWIQATALPWLEASPCSLADCLMRSSGLCRRREAEETFLLSTAT